jgi:FeS assembly SUF system protein
MTDDTQTTPPIAETPQERPSENAAVTGSSALPEDELNKLTDDIVAALKTVYDPEIPADIYELGLIYKIDIGDDRGVKVDMSLTSPNCPAAQELPIQVENAVASVAGVKDARVAVVWDPPWDPSRMSDEARLVLNMW